jgi:hypothetical protein
MVHIFLFEIIYEFFFQFHYLLIFITLKIWSIFFKFLFLSDLVSILLINLIKNKILISYFSAHFPQHSHTLESVFQLIFHDTTKYKKIIHF